MQINVLEYLKESVKRHPQKIAVTEGNKSVTFSEFDRKSQIIAEQILSRGSFRNRPVAVYLPKSADAAISDTGITYSGNIYMNLDIKSPLERVKNILNLVNPVMIITSTGLLGSITEICPAGTFLMNIDTVDFEKSANTGDVVHAYSGLIDTDPYCIINTSGSTGTPKSVVLNHRSFIDFTEWAVDTLKIKEDERIGSLSPVIFDIWSFELCMLMSRGSTIVILQDSLAAFPASLLNLMAETKVSFIFWVPTIMVNIANMDLLSRISLPDLSTVWFAGEVFPTKQFNYWKKYVPHAKFVNLYGPIEITLDCTYYVVERELSDDEPIPIGYPCRNTDILILNSENKKAAVNELGELCVRGSSLAMGYYNNPERTAVSFVQNPLNTSYPELIYRTGDQVFLNDKGEIIFKGRKDTLIKHLGYRIELGEIEHVIINTLKLVENGCVLYDHGRKEIILVYESKNNDSAADMRKAILTVFPKYMVPNSFIRLEQLPRNPNGKIDRLTLGKTYTNHE